MATGEAKAQSVKTTLDETSVTLLAGNLANSSLVLLYTGISCLRIGMQIGYVVNNGRECTPV